MISADQQQRVLGFLERAVDAKATIVTGGGTLGDRGFFVKPTIVTGAAQDSEIIQNEVFGPVVTVQPFGSDDDAIAMANDTRYGLSAGIFTQDIDRAMRFAREVDSGNLHINWGTQWRADLMPYGGVKDSGLGKEGPHYAIREMSEEKMVVFHMNT